MHHFKLFIHFDFCVHRQLGRLVVSLVSFQSLTHTLLLLYRLCHVWGKEKHFLCAFNYGERLHRCERSPQTSVIKIMKFLWLLHNKSFLWETKAAGSELAVTRHSRSTLNWWVDGLFIKRKVTSNFKSTNISTGRRSWICLWVMIISFLDVTD